MSRSSHVMSRSSGSMSRPAAAPPCPPTVTVIVPGDRNRPSYPAVTLVSGDIPLLSCRHTRCHYGHFEQRYKQRYCLYRSLPNQPPIRVTVLSVDPVQTRTSPFPRRDRKLGGSAVSRCLRPLHRTSFLSARRPDRPPADLEPPPTERFHRIMLTRAGSIETRRVVSGRAGGSVAWSGRNGMGWVDSDTMSWALLGLIGICRTEAALVRLGGEEFGLANLI